MITTRNTPGIHPFSLVVPASPFTHRHIRVVAGSLPLTPILQTPTTPRRAAGFHQRLAAWAQTHVTVDAAADYASLRSTVSAEGSRVARPAVPLTVPTTATVGVPVSLLPAAHPALVPSARATTATSVSGSESTSVPVAIAPLSALSPVVAQAHEPRSLGVAFTVTGSSGPTSASDPHALPAALPPFPTLAKPLSAVEPVLAPASLGALSSATATAPLGTAALPGARDSSLPGTVLPDSVGPGSLSGAPDPAS